jgi:hypothetical protein
MRRRIMKILLDNEKVQKGTLLIDITSKKATRAIKSLITQDLEKAIDIIKKKGKVLSLINKKDLEAMDITLMIRRGGNRWEVK